MSLLRSLNTKKEVDEAIRTIENKVLVLRFGKDDEIGCMQTDNIMSRTEVLLSEMAVIYTVNLKDVPEYVDHFDITHIPATLFFFNTIPMKIEAGTGDNTKFVGPLHCKQDFIDLIEMIFRGAMKKKFVINCPIDRRRVTKYETLYKHF